MGTYKRLPRGRRKPTNEFITFAEKTYSWVLMNWKSVALGAGLILILIVVIVGGYRYAGWRKDSAADALAKAQSMSDEVQRRTALILVEDEYRRTPAGRESLLLLGKESLAKGQPGEAVKHFDELAEQSRGYPIMKVYALHQLGTAYERLGDWAKAAEEYATAARTKGNLIKGESLYLQARCLEKLGDYAQAKEIYDELIGDDASADAATKVKSEERLLWLMAGRRVGQQ